MEFKGTKGEWYKMEADKFGVPYIIYANNETIFQCYGEGAKANALLISKAPEMLEMLQEFEGMCNKKQFPTETTLREMRNKARKLIKEATDVAE